MTDELSNLFGDLLDPEGEEQEIIKNPLISDDTQDIEPEETKEEENKEEGENKEPEDASNDGKFEESDAINRVLESKGLDPHAILYEDENGQEVSMNFYDLEPEEQYNLLNYSPSNYDLEDEEIETINFLRENNISLEDYTNYIKQQTLEEALSQKQSYNVDGYNDDELYIEALRSQYPDLTDEELQLELDKEKNNESLFTKKISQIRSFYKEQEDIAAEQTRVENEAKEAAKLEETQNKLAMSAINTKEFMGFELDDEDRKEVFRSIFEKDINGKSLFFKMLEDPDKLFKVAFLALKEDEINKTIEREFKKINNNNKPSIIKTPIIQPKSKVSVKSNSSTSTQPVRNVKEISVDDLYKEML